MKNFTKTLFATALVVAGTGAAHASIAPGTLSGANAELFMQVYDKTNGRTFDLDLGKDAANKSATLLTLNSAIPNQLTLHYDLTNIANWQNFLTGAGNSTAGNALGGAAFDAANSIFGVFVGSGAIGMFTSRSVPTPAVSGWSNAPTAINTQAAHINKPTIAAAGNIAVNSSKLVLDSEPKTNGQAYQGSTVGALPMDSLFGKFSANGGAQAAINFDGDSIANFYSASASGTTMTVTKLGTWTLTSNSLDFNYASPAAVPLPAAVWLFGAGLMGVLRLNRRKSTTI